jgi:hypothetical protein
VSEQGDNIRGWWTMLKTNSAHDRTWINGNRTGWLMAIVFIAVVLGLFALMTFMPVPQTGWLAVSAGAVGLGILAHQAIQKDTTGQG